MSISSIAIRIASVALVLFGLNALTTGRVAANEQDADAPQIKNARMETRALAGPLAAELKRWTSQAARPQWIGYNEPQIAGDREVCCSGSWNDDCGICRLESNDHGVSMNSTSRNATAELEASHEITILFRAENNRITTIRVVSRECALDAGGLPFVWLTGVKPAESVAVLTGYVHGDSFDEREDGRVDHEALAAIALHADDFADRALESFVRPEEREALRKQTAFWLGEARGKAGLAALQTMAKNDPSSDVRAHVTFALSVSREPGAVDEMIRMAHDDESGHVRGQALF